MDSFVEILGRVKWPLAAVVTIIPLAIIFRRQISEGITRITKIHINPRNRGLVIEFGQRIKQEQRRATAVERQITGSHALPGSALLASNGASQTGRDMVLDAFGALKQAVRDGCIANRIPIPPTLGVKEAARRLGGAKGLSPDLVQLIEVVYDVGRDFLEYRLEPLEGDARAYASLAYNAVYWMGVSVLTPEAPPPPPPRRPTVVGGDFMAPTPGSATAALLGVGGPVRGKRFSIDKPKYRIGRNQDNDLCTAADDSVSGTHASLRHEKGGLFLADESSLNGTFLNGQRIAGTPLLVRYGDRIRLGECEFEVVGSSG